jgi:hypothetical protein
MSWVDRWWKEQLSLFFAQLLWKLFASWVPFSSCSMGHQDVYSNRGAQANLLPLEYPHVFVHESMELVDSVVEENSQRHLEHGQTPSAGSEQEGDVECISEDGGLVTTPRRRGRPKKKRVSLSGNMRGRPKGSKNKLKAPVSVSEVVTPVQPQPDWEPEGVTTRARRALKMAKIAGVKLFGSEEEVLEGLKAQVRDQFEEYDKGGFD